MFVENIIGNIAIDAVARLFKGELKKASKQKETYAQKLETASGNDVFKYLLLTNTSALEAYVAQTRIQAQQSFRVSMVVAVLGFLLISVGIALGIYSDFSGETTLQPAYLASVAGILTEFISGIFFYLYNKTLQQLNRFHDKLLSTQHTSMSLLANSLITDEAKRDDSRAELAKQLMSNVVGNP